MVMDQERLKRLHGIYKDQQTLKIYQGIKKVCAAHGLEIREAQPSNIVALPPQEPDVTIIPPRHSRRLR